MTSDISIFEHLRTHIRPDGAGLTEAGETLPDEDEMTGVPWAPGAQDGVLTHHWAGKGEDDEVRRL
ncbi:hypothetical protein ACFQ07_04010, partial [Actinomadura adrarensis]